MLLKEDMFFPSLASNSASGNTWTSVTDTSARQAPSMDRNDSGVLARPRILQLALRNTIHIPANTYMSDGDLDDEAGKLVVLFGSNEIYQQISEEPECKTWVRIRGYGSARQTRRIRDGW